MFQIECLWNVFKVLTKVAKKGSCHGYQVTKENKIAKEYFR